MPPCSLLAIMRRGGLIVLCIWLWFDGALVSGLHLLGAREQAATACGANGERVP
jgi:hypothetical protein